MSYSNQKKKWIIKEPVLPYSSQSERENIVRKISAEFNIPAICAGLIADRGFRTSEDVHSFIFNNYITGRDPFLLADMDRAVERLKKAIQNPDEVVAIFGDYDVDGVTSVSTLYLYLISKGVKVGYFIPKRSEGYGMNKSAIGRLASHGVTLIITVDTGITAIEEIDYAKSLGIDTIVTDHHECRAELPDCCAVVNPHRQDCSYPFKELAGVGVVYKLITAMEIRFAREEGRNEYEAERNVLLSYADLVSIGTVADVMPIVDENRMIVSFGLKMLSQSRRKGITALIEASAKRLEGQMTSSFISFTIAPRLNAAGRMDNASIAVELLLCNNDIDAAKMAERLCEINQQRQVEENRIATEAEEKLAADPTFMDDRVIILDSDDWMHGVIGIVSSRITEKYSKPSILITFDGATTPGIRSPLDEGKGSGRSISGLNLFNALSDCEDLLLRYGGHELAAGLSVRRRDIPMLRRKLNEYAKNHLSDDYMIPTYEADMEISPEMITLELSDDITRIMEPCSTGNPLPVFIMRDVVLTQIRPISSGKHTKMLVKKDGLSFQAIFYGASVSDLNYDVGDNLDLMFTLSTNTYQGVSSVQLILCDVCFSKKCYEKRLYDRKRVNELLSGSFFSPADNYLPERDDFVAIFGILNDFLKSGKDSFSDRYMMNRLKSDKLDTRINYVKYKLILSVLSELDIFRIHMDPVVSDEIGSQWCLPQDYVSVQRVFHPRKVELDSSNILSNLKIQSGIRS